MPDEVATTVVEKAKAKGKKAKAKSFQELLEAAKKEKADIA